VAALKVFALRRGGFNGPIELSADGLPADVKFLGGSIPKGQSIGYASFYAEETAEAWAGPVNLHGKTGGAVLVWITDLGPNQTVVVGEAHLTS
jgi:hypothetical protein